VLIQEEGYRLKMAIHHEPSSREVMQYCSSRQVLGSCSWRLMLLNTSCQTEQGYFGPK
jgi:hypothetical protein